MAVRLVNLRDAIILSMLQDGFQSKQDIERKFGMQKSVARQSLSVLKTSGLIAKQRINGNDFYLITDKGNKSIKKVYQRLSLV